MVELAAQMSVPSATHPNKYHITSHASIMRLAMLSLVTDQSSSITHSLVPRLPDSGMQTSPGRESLVSFSCEHGHNWKRARIFRAARQHFAHCSTNYMSNTLCV